jgi:aldose 1-epimerase
VPCAPDRLTRPGWTIETMAAMATGRTAGVPVTGSQYRIEAGDYAAAVTELGAGLRELRHRGQQVIACYQPDVLPPGAAGQLLAPWPNRIDGGRYTLAGTSYQLDLSEPAQGNAIHGLTRWAPWAPIRHSRDAVLLRVGLLGHTGYPFCLEIDAEYHLSGDDGLRVSVTARNTGSRPAPYGTGSHPYLTAGTATVDECALTLPAARWLPVADRGIPVGGAQDVTGTDADFRTGRPVGVTRLDHALTGLVRDAQGRAWARLASERGEIALWVDERYPWLQVFTGDTLDAAHRRRAVAVEPMTCPPNAFATGTDLIMLDPGDSVTTAWGIQVSVPATPEG